MVSQDEETQSTALRWMDRFIDMFGEHLLAFAPELLAAILPCLAHAVDPIRNLAIETNANFFRLVSEAQQQFDGSFSAAEPLSASIATVSSSNSVSVIEPFDVEATVSTLTVQFQDDNEETRVASMDWLIMLHKRAPKKVCKHTRECEFNLLKSVLTMFMLDFFHGRRVVTYTFESSV